jgi:hypothetical protein
LIPGSRDFLIDLQSFIAFGDDGEVVPAVIHEVIIGG